MSGSQLKIGFIMDPIESINIKKDSTFAMMLEVQRRGWTVYYLQQADLYADDGVVFAGMTRVTVTDHPQQWFVREEVVTRPLHELDALFMRKDPPFDMEYIYSTYLLELAEQRGLLVVNKPASVRAANEKLFTAWFPEFSPATRVTRDMQRIRDFLAEQQRIVVKPLDGMGGAMVFQVCHDDPNTSVILETITDYGQRTVMAQQFLPAFRQGDKRVLLINGEPFPYGLVRVPAEGESRGNLAAGASSVGRELTTREREICAAIGPKLMG